MSAPRGRFGSVMISTKKTGQSDELQSLQLVDMAPNSAPQATFLRLPNETTYDHSLYLQTGMSATTDITQIRVIDECLEAIQRSISKFYCRRSIMEPLQKYLKATPENTAALVEIAKRYADPLVKVINDAMEQAQASSQKLFSILSAKNQWVAGQYSIELIVKVCELIFKLFVLDKLRSAKTAVIIDLEALSDIISKGSSATVVTSAMTKWLKDPDSIEKALLDALRPIPGDQMELVSHIFWKYIKEALAGEPMLPEEKYALLVSLAILVKVCPRAFQMGEAAAVKNLFEQTPFVPLYHEFAFNICEFVGKTDLFRSQQKLEEKPVEPRRLMGQLRKKFSEVSTRLHLAAAGSEMPDRDSANEIICASVEAISLLSSTTGMLREQYAAKLANPPEEPAEMKPYERSVRHGFKPDELKSMLQLVALCRELSDLMRTNIPSIYPKLCSSIQHSFQDIVKNVLEKAYVKCKRKKKSVRKIIEQMRGVSCDFCPGENPAIPTKKGDVKPRDIPKRAAPPSPQLIELIRIEVQHLLNPESRFMQPSKKMLKMMVKRCLPDKQEKRLTEFLKESANWVNLLMFEQSLARASDQSSFYFKEVHLDINHTVQFPVRSSLPFILCEFALNNYVQPELTELIFYPLSIYDDAANVAVYEHKSRMMFDEIRAEAQVSLDTLSVLIGEFTFNAFRTFAALRQISDKVAAQLRVEHARHWPHSHAYRLRTLLQQNHYYLLSRQVALKSLIGARVDQELNSAVAKLYGIGQDLGVVASIAISKVSSIISQTHNLLIEHGLPMMPFKDIERTARWDNVLQSFYSKYLRDVSKHLFRNVCRKFALCVNPLRLIPPKKVQLPSDPLGKLNLGRILKDALEASVSFVTVEHFSVLMRQVSDGSIVLLAQSIHKHIRQSFDHLIEKYRDVCGRVTRIKDATLGTSAHSAFTRYEGAYKFFLNDTAVLALLRAMQNVGNTFAVAELIDEALSLKQFNVVQILSYLRSADNNGQPRDEIDRLFDQDFRDSLQIVTARPMTIAESSQQLLLSMVVNEFLSLVQRDIHTFDEPNAKSTDFTSMTGFASVWSVIEFVYCLMESTRLGEQTDTGFPEYGQGVMLCAALILLATNQVDLSRVLSVGRKMQRHKETDMSGIQDDKILRFLSVSKLDTAIIDWALLFFRPYVLNFRTQ